jgi:hypothetical protein
VVTPCSPIQHIATPCRLRRKTIQHIRTCRCPVYISGAQHHDASVSRAIVVHELHYDHPITIGQALRRRR